MSLSIRTAARADLDQLRDIYRRSSLHNDGDRVALLAHPEALVFAPQGTTTTEFGPGLRMHLAVR
jgi:hypothetical protein